jgi:hypothetical protein
MMRRRGVRATLGLCAAALLALTSGGCGGDSACESAGKKLCARACECTAGDECTIGQGFSLSFESESDCVGFWVQLGCMEGGDEDVDYDACADALDDAMCVEGEMGLELPMECGGDDGADEPDAGGAGVDAAS